MKNQTLALVAAASLLGASLASAQFYAGAGAALLDGDNRYSTWGTTLHAGFELPQNDSLSHGLDLQYVQTSDDSAGYVIVTYKSNGDPVNNPVLITDLDPILLNYKFRYQASPGEETGFSAYAGFGVGITRNSFTVNGVRCGEDAFTWQLGVGGEYKVWQGLAVYASYQYLTIDDVDGQGFPIDLGSANLFEVGARWRF